MVAACLFIKRQKTPWRVLVAFLRFDFAELGILCAQDHGVSLIQIYLVQFIGVFISKE